MNVKELRDYLNSIPSEFDKCKVKIQGFRTDKDYHDLEITTLEQSKSQLQEYGMVFEIDSFDIYDVAMKISIDTMIDIEEHILNKKE